MLKCSRLRLLGDFPGFIPSSLPSFHSCIYLLFLHVLNSPCTDLTVAAGKRFIYSQLASCCPVWQLLHQQEEDCIWSRGHLLQIQLRRDSRTRENSRNLRNNPEAFIVYFLCCWCFNLSSCDEMSRNTFLNLVFPSQRVKCLYLINW